jgi:N-methylhydantoinase B
MRVRPYGLFGGEPGAPTSNTLVHDGVERPMDSKFTVWIHRGDVFDHRQAGGGGYGDPLDRDPEAVWRDVRDGRVSPGLARSAYGVVLSLDGRAVDAGATDAERRRMRTGRRKDRQDA